ncbi:Small-conductance mechanosensitive channel [Plesiocystis pacifica SIR-1]|uniref:Small-conductance mechanosensitive channel n=1 Tax=Plesiocystis pacifica SIR-1 TaxID=391625 RepID=A6G2I2_9BACT|nr:mechanosensitive ion channel family protein [Plesiocystis pacifica]EDM79919.1 Small-conductance mechanosensitive channel [Plesiocystis pacifica SIR-1]
MTINSIPDALTSPLDRLSTKLIGWGQTAIEMLPNFILAVLVVIGFGLVARHAGRALARALDRLMNNEALSSLLSNVVKVAFVIAGLSIALSLLHLDKAVTSLLAGVGVVGLALGFAFQDIAANFISGALLAFRGPFDAGDIIEVEGRTGTVEEIHLRRTVLRTFDGLNVIVPNKDVFQSVLVNYSRTEERRVDLDLGVAYSDDLERAKETAREALEDLSLRDLDRPIEVLFTGFGDSAINLQVRVWLAEPTQFSYLEARSDMVIAIKSAFDAAGLTIPFPIRTLDFGAMEVGGASLAEVIEIPSSQAQGL